MQITLEGPLTDTDDLPTDLTDSDVGRTWFIGVEWFIWTAKGWLAAIATSTKPKA